MNESFSLYGEFSLGLNYSTITSIKYESGDKTSFNSLIGITYGLEAGVIVKNVYTISLRYTNPGSYKYKYDDGDEYFNKALPISLASLAVGYKF